MTQPRLGCALLVEEGEGPEQTLLLIQSGKPAIYGKWVIPGGGIEEGETPQQAGIRELDQEAGIKVKVGAHAYTGEVKAADGTVERRIEFYRATRISGELTPGDDALAVKPYTRAGIAHLVATDQSTPFMGEVFPATGWL